MVRYILFLMVVVLSQNIQAQSQDDALAAIQIVGKNQVIHADTYEFDATLESRVTSVISANSEKFLKEKALHQLKLAALDKNYALLQNVTYKVEKENYGKKRKITVIAQAKAYKMKA